MCLVQGPQCSDVGEARTRGISILSQALTSHHWATVLPLAWIFRLNELLPFLVCLKWKLWKCNSRQCWPRSDFFSLLVHICNAPYTYNLYPCWAGVKHHTLTTFTPVGLVNSQDINFFQTYMYSKTCLKRPLKKKTKIGFQDRLSFNAGQMNCRMLQESILQYFRPS